MLTMLRSALSWKNAWHIRMVALGIIVLCVGIGSQVLVNVIAASADTTDIDTGLIPVQVTAYTISGKMTDGDQTYLGACAVAQSQFPLGTIIALYAADGTFVRQCTAEDTNKTINDGHIELAMPGNTSAATQWGVRYLSARVVRLGWGPAGPPIFSTTSATPIPPMQIVRPPLARFK